MKKILIGASIFAVSALVSTGAWANPQNVFSDCSHNEVSSEASSWFGTANAESFNVNQNAVSVQSLEASSSGSWNTASADCGNASVSTGSASIAGGSNNAGVTSGSANAGSGSAIQQGVSLAALGTVNVGH